MRNKPTRRPSQDAASSRTRRAPTGLSESTAKAAPAPITLASLRGPILLAAVLLLALFVRIRGISWGLPNPLHDFSYHPDETVMLIHSTPLIDPHGVNLLAGQILPHFYNYGSLQLYLANIVITIAGSYFVSTQPPPAGVFPYHQFATVYLAARALTAVMGVGTVWAVYALGARLYGRAAGLIGAGLLAVTPLHAQHSHFFTVDVPATFWMTLSLLWAAKAIRPRPGERGGLFPFPMAGLFAGLATATKYNAAIVFLSVVGAAVIGEITLKKSDPARPSAGAAAFAALGALLVAFVIACPGSLLESQQFMTDVRFEAAHVSGQGELWFQKTGIGWVYIVTRNLDAGMGLALLLASAAGIGTAIYRRTPGDALLALTALPYYLVVGAAQSRYARYEIPLLPIMALWTGRMIAEGLRMPRLRIAALAAATVVPILTAADCYVLVRPMTQVDPRDRAAVALSLNAPPPTQIGFATTPWFWSPPVVPLFSLPGPNQWRESGVNPALLQRLVFNDDKPFDSKLLISAHPSFVVLSEYEYYDRLRLHDPDTLAYLAQLRRAYQPPVVFASVHPIGGLMTLGGLPVQDLPHDMLYPSPTQLIFVKKQ